MRDGRLLRWPYSACKTDKPSVALPRSLRRLHTSPLVLLRPKNTTEEGRSPDGSTLTSSSVRECGDESWTPPRPLLASLLGSGSRCDVSYAVASVAHCGPLPESHR